MAINTVEVDRRNQWVTYMVTKVIKDDGSKNGDERENNS